MLTLLVCCSELEKGSSCRFVEEIKAWQPLILPLEPSWTLGAERLRGCCQVACQDTTSICACSVFHRYRNWLCSPENQVRFPKFIMCLYGFLGLFLFLVNEIIVWIFIWAIWVAQEVIIVFNCALKRIYIKIILLLLFFLFLPLLLLLFMTHSPAFVTCSLLTSIQIRDFVKIGRE